MTRIAIFASGAGTNANEIMKHLNTNPKVMVSLVVSNNPTAGVLTVADNFKVPSIIINKAEYFTSESLLKTLTEYNIDWIVLAGFLWLIPPYLLNAFPDKIINIHPALLPKYGGKGMYGNKVHEAVVKNMESKSGITIHYVNEQFDKGEIIFQAKCDVDPSDTPDSLAKKIHGLEHKHFPKIIEQLTNEV